MVDQFIKIKMFGSSSTVYNSGAAFGILAGSTFLFILAFFGIMLFIYRSRGLFFGDPYLRLSVSLLIGGAVSNLVDRLRVGFVIDYLKLPLLSFWPSFNLADLVITIAAATMVVRLIFARDGDRTQNNI